MLASTVSRLKCPKKKRGKTCDGQLELFADETITIAEVQEVRTGRLECGRCKAKFPILAGVALLVPDVRLFLLQHVKGISKTVADQEIPREYRREFIAAKAQIETEHIEEDLEAERVNALYLMNHYLRVHDSGSLKYPWWKPLSGAASPVIDCVVREYWDHGPFARIEQWIGRMAKKDSEGVCGALVELGCGVGGLYPVLKPFLSYYLGVDSSFSSIMLARHFALGMPYAGSIGIPEDLLHGPVSREINLAPATPAGGQADFVAGDLDALPVKSGEWDVSIALNTIDMLERPSALPEIQRDLLADGAIAIQSCPYIWHEAAASQIREVLPSRISDSASAVEWLYEQAGFAMEERFHHVPWLFFKHVRQLEIYSVHMFLARKSRGNP
ncbi:MAG: hypothetical protein A2428_00810 [Bdellovibrionales bacterium RIFOXYC1_FULL_54_43]|nr:MAG: hypothetical protein A2428_00810 [Bdellovibrionales bacterium RIFOXYC1_FULL_54_43]OFZ81309.1 MAG: hypothetical protein A2603_16450 [Bdellovibrionales bacterium RIFOXYD1_FULL_55_31]